MEHFTLISDLEGERKVTKEQGIQTVRKYKLSGFMEVSPQMGQKVDHLFETITEILINKYQN